MAPKIYHSALRSSKSVGFFAVLFFFAIALPALFIVVQAFKQIKWESFHQFQGLAIEFSSRVDSRIKELVEQEEARSFAAYSFVVASGSPFNNYVQRSPLADSKNTPFPGFVGYFQIDPENQFSTPLLPNETEQAKNYGLGAEQIAEREQKQENLKRIFEGNKISLQQPVDSVVQQLVEKKRQSNRQLKKEVTNRSLEDLKLDLSYQPKAKGKANSAGSKEGKSTGASRYPSKSRALKFREQKELLVEKQEIQEAAPMEAASKKEEPVYSLFESRISPFETTLLESGHLLFYRFVWQQKQRYVQGFILQRDTLIQSMLELEFRENSLSSVSTLALIWNNQVLKVISTQQRYASYLAKNSLSGTLLHRYRLSAPLDDGELLFTVENLPTGKSGQILLITALSFFVILLVASWLGYRLVIKQQRLAAQQQNFVSSISHELKTPLTSIKMYGEILREGWASEEKRREYYDYIYYESERLGRLISNVLQLARLTRADLPVQIKNCTLGELMDLSRSTVSSQVERAGFELEVECPDPEILAEVDVDLFVQIVINLVDNALKFSRKSSIKKVNLCFSRLGDKQVQVSVRDFGPGVDKNQIRKIFTLFYRAENELTRETRGTGIGLALVNQLIKSMGGEISVENKEPGAEFSLWLKSPTSPLKAELVDS